MLKKIIFIIIFIFILIIALFILFFPSAKNGVVIMYNLATGKEIGLNNSNGAINILLLGIGGGSHDGPNLTDTIIVANINRKKNEINLISIPRDLWVPDLSSKINAAYSDGQEKNNKGKLVASAVIKKVIGQPINYTVVFDFSGFEKMVDLIGGIDVNVQNTFDDYEYPIAGKENDLCGHTQEELQVLATDSAEQSVKDFSCRYEHLHFDKGLTHMDGSTALEFVRSRHAVQAIEQSDFARSRRQHEVIIALKDKMLTLGTLFNPIKILGIYNVLKDNIDTDIKTEQVDDFIRLAQEMKNPKINNYVLDTGDENEKRLGLLINPPVSSDFGYQWVLIPRIGKDNFSEIQKYIDCITSGKICSVTETSVLISN